MTRNTILLTAVYEDVGMALADLRAVEELHKEEVIGKYDAAVVANQNGTPQIAKRMDRPRTRIIPELLGSGTLPRKELEGAAQVLRSGSAGLIAVGEPTLEKGFDKAVTRAAKTSSRIMDAASDELSDELTAAFTE